MSDDDVSSGRVQQALAGKLFVEDLTNEEASAFWSTLGESMRNPRDAERAFYAALGDGTGAIGTVIAMAVAVWKGPSPAIAWLRRPHPLLDGQSPLLVAATAEGARRVMDILGRLQHGTAA